jgi:hypothetical protein
VRRKTRRTRRRKTRKKRRIRTRIRKRKIRRIKSISGKEVMMKSQLAKVILRPQEEM